MRRQSRWPGAPGTCRRHRSTPGWWGRTVTGSAHPVPPPDVPGRYPPRHMPWQQPTREQHRPGSTWGVPGSCSSPWRCARHGPARPGCPRAGALQALVGPCARPVGANRPPASAWCPRWCRAGTQRTARLAAIAGGSGPGRSRPGRGAGHTPGPGRTAGVPAPPHAAREPPTSAVRRSGWTAPHGPNSGRARPPVP
ncbi:hypothetical protein D3C77_494800 [compost metagenome]